MAKKRKDDTCPFSFYFTGGGSNAESQKFVHYMVTYDSTNKYADVIEFTDRKGQKEIALIIGAQPIDKEKSALWLNEFHTPRWSNEA